MNSDKKKYLFVLMITIGIFIIVFGLVNFLNNQRLESLDDLQRKVTIDLIANETQFDLLKTAPCGSIKDTILSRELGELGKKLDFAENNQGADNTSVIQLKKYYSLLQVKDYLLMQELSEKCDVDIDSILYFYGNDCSECTKQGYVLTQLKNRYPELRIYSFDTDLDFSVIETFTSLYDFGEAYPTLIIGDNSYQGLQRISDIEELFPDLLERKKDIEELDEIFNFIIKNTDEMKKDISVNKISEKEYSFLINDQDTGTVSINKEGEKIIRIDKEVVDSFVDTE
jgi:hypothetical protein